MKECEPEIDVIFHFSEPRGGRKTENFTVEVGHVSPFTRQTAAFGSQVAISSRRGRLV